MRWSDDGLFLTGRPHGETSVIADIFTRHHGRTPGLVKGGRSRRIRPILQTGNGLRVDWRARLEDQLGVYTVELTDPTAARVLDEKLPLAGIASLVSLLRVMPERDPHPQLFEAAADCLAVAGGQDFAAAIVRFELRFLDELGFGLDLSRCAATGTSNGLTYVSPKSGQAVCTEAAGPYKHRLLALPPFLIDNGKAPSASDVTDGLRLTGYFLKEHVFADAAALPKARQDFEHLLARSGPQAETALQAQDTDQR